MPCKPFSAISTDIIEEIDYLGAKPFCKAGTPEEAIPEGSWANATYLGSTPTSLMGQYSYIHLGGSHDGGPTESSYIHENEPGMVLEIA